MGGFDFGDEGLCAGGVAGAEVDCGWVVGGEAADGFGAETCVA